MAVDRLDDEGDRRPTAADSPVTREAAVPNTEPDSVTDRPDFAARTARVDDYRATVDAVYRAHAIDQGCARAREIEEIIVTPVIRSIEAEDSTRHLVGLDHRLKGKDRIEENSTARRKHAPAPAPDFDRRGRCTVPNRHIPPQFWLTRVCAWSTPGLPRLWS